MKRVFHKSLEEGIQWLEEELLSHCKTRKSRYRVMLLILPNIKRACRSVGKSVVV